MQLLLFLMVRIYKVDLVHGTSLHITISDATTTISETAKETYETHSWGGERGNKTIETIYKAMGEASITAGCVKYGGNQL